MMETIDIDNFIDDSDSIEDQIKELSIDIIPKIIIDDTKSKIKPYKNCLILYPLVKIILKEH